MRKPTMLLAAGLAALIFAPLLRAAEPAAADALYSEPMPRNWAAPAYPPEAIKAGAEGRVFIEFIVDAEGRVTDPKVRENKKKPNDPRLEEAVLAAAKLWTFAPALNANKPEPRAVGVLVGFYLKGRGGKPSVDLPRQPDTAPTKPAKPLLQADPSYPDELLTRKLPGAAEFEFEVSTEGRARDIKVLYASDAAFVGPGLATVRGWTFEPGRQGPLPVPTRKQSPMQFYVEGDQTRPEDILAANGISGLAANEYSKAPSTQVLFAPVYPRARFTAKEAGEAEVEFVVRENGLTDFVTITSSSQPEFGASLAAAVALWQFRPAYKSGERTTVKLRVHHYFAISTTETDPDNRLAVALQAGIAGAGGLDRSLAPIWRIPPRYPPTLHGEKPAGEAVIEFIIDREGRCRLPRVVSATHEDFGWAAATAISQWVFEAPSRGGQPADVRVSIPVSFTAPTD